MHGFEAALSLTRDVLQVLLGPTGYGICVWFLVGIFAWSGIAKLRQPALAAKALVDFGVTRRLHPHFGLALGAAESLLALALALGIHLHFFLFVAAILLWSFVLLITRSLWSGKRFPCFCFGNADSQLSRWTLARTGALALLASLLALTPVPIDLLRDWSAGNLLQAIAALAVLAILVLVSYIPRLLAWNRDLLMQRRLVEGE